MSRAQTLPSAALRPPGGVMARPWTHKATSVTLLLFLVSCVFDPADRLFGLKVWLFMLAWVLTIGGLLASRVRPGLPQGLFVYVGLFMAVPGLSLAHVAFIGSTVPFEGFDLMKGYVLVTLAPLLVLSRIDVLARLCSVLTVLALVIIATYLALQANPEFYGVLYLFGVNTGIVMIDTRAYGDDVSLLQVYFVTSPMLALSISWYTHRARAASSRVARWGAWALVALHVTAMLLAGTRNNIMVAMLLPLTLWIISARNKPMAALVVAAMAMLLALVFSDELRAFFDPSEVSNNAKIGLLNDYARILSDPLTLLFGQGLGSYEVWSTKSETFYISELTYLELVRNFGLPGALLMLGLLLYPVWHAFVAGRSRVQRTLSVGYAFYLVMCISNPNLFSSMGILILCVLLSCRYLPCTAHGPS